MDVVFGVMYAQPVETLAMVALLAVEGWGLWRLQGWILEKARRAGW